jgi:hypothetical protein
MIKFWILVIAFIPWITMGFVLTAIMFVDKIDVEDGHILTHLVEYFVSYIVKPLGFVSVYIKHKVSEWLNK